jgi:hypothetical protein
VTRQRIRSSLTQSDSYDLIQKLSHWLSQFLDKIKKYQALLSWEEWQTHASNETKEIIQRQSGEIKEEKIYHNHRHVGSVFYYEGEGGDLGKKDLFTTKVFQQFKFNFIFKPKFIRFAGMSIYMIHENKIFVLCSENKEPDKDQKTIDLLGGYVHFGSDKSPAHTAAREFVEETSDKKILDNEDFQRVEEIADFLEKQPDENKIVVFKSILNYALPFQSLPDCMKKQLPDPFGGPFKFQNNVEKKTLFWKSIDELIKEKKLRQTIEYTICKLKEKLESKVLTMQMNNLKI